MNSLKAQASNDPLQFACQFQIPVVHLNELKHVLKKEAHKWSHSPKILAARGIKLLNGSFLKIEDMSFNYMPLFRTFSSIPNIYPKVQNTPSSGNKFNENIDNKDRKSHSHFMASFSCTHDPKSIKKPKNKGSLKDKSKLLKDSHNILENHVNSQSSKCFKHKKIKELSKNTSSNIKIFSNKKQIKKQPLTQCYCECCEEIFDCLSTHRLSHQHESFFNQSSNLVLLDQVIAGFPLFSEQFFINLKHDVSSCNAIGISIKEDGDDDSSNHHYDFQQNLKNNIKNHCKSNNISPIKISYKPSKINHNVRNSTDFISLSESSNIKKQPLLEIKEKEYFDSLNKTPSSTMVTKQKGNLEYSRDAIIDFPKETVVPNFTDENDIDSNTVHLQKTINHINTEIENKDVFTLIKKNTIDNNNNFLIKRTNSEKVIEILEKINSSETERNIESGNGVISFASLQHLITSPIISNKKISANIESKQNKNVCFKSYELENNDFSKKDLFFDDIMEFSENNKNTKQNDDIDVLVKMVTNKNGASEKNKHFKTNKNDLSANNEFKPNSIVNRNVDLSDLKKKVSVNSGLIEAQSINCEAIKPRDDCLLDYNVDDQKILVLKDMHFSIGKITSEKKSNRNYAEKKFPKRSFTKFFNRLESKVPHIGRLKRYLTDDQFGEKKGKFFMSHLSSFQGEYDMKDMNDVMDKNIVDVLVPLVRKNSINDDNSDDDFFNELDLNIQDDHQLVFKEPIKESFISNNDRSTCIDTIVIKDSENSSLNTSPYSFDCMNEQKNIDNWCDTSVEKNSDSIVKMDVSEELGLYNVKQVQVFSNNERKKENSNLFGKISPERDIVNIFCSKKDTSIGIKNCAEVNDDSIDLSSSNITVTYEDTENYDFLDFDEKIESVLYNAEPKTASPMITNSEKSHCNDLSKKINNTFVYIDSDESLTSRIFTQNNNLDKTNNHSNVEVEIYDVNTKEDGEGSKADISWLYEKKNVSQDTSPPTFHRISPQLKSLNTSKPPLIQSSPSSSSPALQPSILQADSFENLKEKHFNTNVHLRDDFFSNKKDYVNHNSLGQYLRNYCHVHLMTQDQCKNFHSMNFQKFSSHFPPLFNSHNHQQQLFLQQQYQYLQSIEQSYINLLHNSLKNANELSYQALSNSYFFVN